MKTNNAKVKRQKANLIGVSFFKQATPLKFAFCLLTFAFLSSCVPLDQLPPGSVPGMPSAGLTPASFGALDAGSTSVSSIHFVLKGYNEGDLRTLSGQAEDIYNKIGNDTGLYSFLASANLIIVVYKDQTEYAQKAHQPQWSHAVSLQNTLYTYAGQQDLAPYVAHELSHMIFYAYMPDKVQTFKWLQEGLAMYEELAKMSDADRSAFASLVVTRLRSNKTSFSQMTFFSPLTEETRRTDDWFLQVYSVTNYLLTQGGSALTFGAFMNELKNTGDIDRALANAYPAKFHGLTDLENAWKTTV